MKKIKRFLSVFLTLALLLNVLLITGMAQTADSVTVAFLGQLQKNDLIPPYSQTVSEYIAKRLNAEVNTVVADMVDIDADGFMNSLVDDIIPQNPDAVFIELDISEIYTITKDDLTARLESMVLALTEAEKIPAIYFIYVPEATMIDNRAPFDKVAERYDIDVLDAYSYLKKQYQDGTLKTSDFLTAGVMIGEQGHNHVARVVNNALAGINDLFRVPLTGVKPISSVRYGKVEAEETQETPVAKEPTQIYVALNGNDAAAGTIDAPINTLTEAKNRVRALKKSQGDSFQGVTVYLREGLYRIPSTLSFGEEDSGYEDAPVIYTAYENETVRFTNGNILNPKAFSPVTDKQVLKRLHTDGLGHILEYDLKAAGIDPGLFLAKEVTQEKLSLTQGAYVSGAQFGNVLGVNGRGQQRSRYPNAGWETIAEHATGSNMNLAYNGKAPERWDLTKSDGYVHSMLGAGYFSYTIQMSSIDTVQKLINFSTAAAISASGYVWRAMNLLEEVDIPGEWYADQKSGKLYYYPHDDFYSSEIIFSSNMNPVVEVKKGKYITLKNISFESSAGDGVLIEDGNTITLDGCTFTNLGHVGVKITNSGTGEFGNNGIINSHFYHLGIGGVAIIGGDKQNLTFQNDYIINCHFEDYSLLGHHSSGALHTMDAVGIVLRHNNFHNDNASAVSLASAEVKMEYNEMYNVPKESDDTGVIYSQYEGATMQGTLFKNNYMHNVTNTDVIPHHGNLQGFSGVKGFFMDGAAGFGTKVTNNVFVNVAGAVLMSEASDQFIENNLVLDPPAIAMGVINSHRTEDTDWEKEVYAFYDKHIANGTLEDLRGDYNRGAATRDYRFYIAYLQNTYFAGENQKTYFLKYPWLEHYTEGQYLRGRNMMYRHNAIYNPPSDRQAITIGGYPDDKYNVDNYIVNDERFSTVGVNKPIEIIEAAMADAKQNLEGYEPWDIRQAGLTDDPKPVGDFRIISPVNGARGTSATDLSLTWEYASGADEYRVLIATDPDFKNIVFDKVSLEDHIRVKNVLQAGCKQYYWKVIAKSFSAKFTGEPENNNGVYTFYTQRYYDADKAALEKVLFESTNFYETMVAGDAGGQYPPDVKTDFKREIDEAQKVFDNLSAKQENVDSARENLRAAYMLAKSKVNLKELDLHELYTDPYSLISVVNTSNITDSVYALDTVTITDDAFTLDGTGTVMTKEKFGPENVLRFTGTFDYKNEEPTGSIIIGIGLPNYQYYAYRIQNSFIFIKPDRVELQVAKPHVQSVGRVYEMVPNTCLTPGVKHDIEFCALPHEKGARIIFRVDGEIIFDYIDTVNPYTEKGYLTLSNGVFGLTVEKPMENTGYPTLLELLQDPESELNKAPTDE